MSTMNENSAKVYLLGVTENGDQILASAAMISRTQGDAITVFNSRNDKKSNAKVIATVKDHGHESFLEHLYFNFALNDVTAAFEQYLIEYRLASFTIKSRRYVDFSEAGFNEFGIFNSDKYYNKLYNNHIGNHFHIYNEFIKSGINKEDARYALSYCFRSNIIFSLNARELRHILYRMIYIDGLTNEEIYNVGIQMLNIVSELYPTVFDNLGKSERAFSKIESNVSELIFNNNDIINESVKGKVELISYTPDAIKVLLTSVLIVLGKYNEENLEKALNSEEIKNELINYVLARPRKGDLEKIDLTYILKNLSLPTLTHLSRHRMQSLTVPYVATALERNNYIIPESIKADRRLKDIYVNEYGENKLLYDSLVKSGNVPAHELVYLALSGNIVDVMTKMNARELITFFGLRTCERAQWEMRNVAIEMLRQARTILPDIFNHYGPRCYMDGSCPEMDLSCGKAKEMKLKFSQELK